MDFFAPIVNYMTNKKMRVEANYRTDGYFKDIMIKGQDFYAIYDKDKKLWSTNKGDAIRLIDKELFEYAKDYSSKYIKDDEMSISVKSLSGSTTKGIDDFNHWYQKQTSDTFEWLNSKIIFNDQETERSDYATFKLPYSMKAGDTSGWDTLVGRLYSDEEKRKIEYAIGSIISGDSKTLQKFFIFVGDAGTGKSTIMKIISDMFDGYVSTIDIKSIGMGASFALESLRSNPLISIQDDVDLSRIEDNARLNSIVSHERIMVNEKHKSQYEAKFHTIIFAGTNREVKITDARSGLLRRMIDIEPTGDTFKRREYDDLMNRIKFEYGAICKKCYDIYEEDPGYYNRYYPVKMIRATNHLYNFVEENYMDILDENNGTTLNVAWTHYTRYCELSEMKYKLDRLKFKIELKDYFEKFLPDTERDGHRYYNYYSGFKFSKVGITKSDEDGQMVQTWLKFGMDDKGYFDHEFEECKAQYATLDGVPSRKWDSCHTLLKNIDPKKLHYVKVPENHIVIDFDIKDPETGDKSFELNMAAASKWPPTYAELSKSEAGIHLHYIYDGDVSQLSTIYDKDIEVKIFSGGASLRRKLTQCVNLPIATINSGLPLKEKGGENMVSDFVINNEKTVVNMLTKCLKREYNLGGTKPFVEYMYDILENAYKNNVVYDVRPMRKDILAFANNSSNHSEYCVGLVSKMHFYNDKIDDTLEEPDNYDCGYSKEAPIAFFDVEVLPNLFVLVYKFAGEENECIKLINPSPDDVKDIIKFRLIGFNNRRYDNHILWARMLGYSEYQLYKLSKAMIDGSANATFLNAYNISYTDVYDFASNVNKMGLKKWEIKLDIHHLELGLDWDKDVPEELWDKVADYCCNDVISTEILFNHLKGDWAAREILSDISGLTVNNTTNQHSTKIIFGNNKHPQDEFLYRDLSKPVKHLDPEVSDFLWSRFPDMMTWWRDNTDSLLPYFPGYTYENGKSTYKGIVVGEGGYVEALQGIFGLVGLFDVASMHPHSMLTECLFGPKYTRILAELVDGRITIKHKDWEYINDILGGKLTKYVQLINDGTISSKDLANALKTVINSVYGLTSAKFDNAFRDLRNKDNIVAKRGALFMVDLAEEVRNHGYLVAHIKTDSIKVPDVTEEIAKIITDFGKRYGYSFEWEATYDKMCLINDAVYIARYVDDGEKHEEELSTGEKILTNWTATGQRFAEPYVFKTLFSKTPLKFKDFCQTKNVAKGSMYLDLNEDNPDSHNYVFVGKTGSFCPVKPGKGGGELLCLNNDKYSSVTGTKGHRWLESEVVRSSKMEDDIDISYFDKLADEARSKIEELGGFDYFVSDAKYDGKVPYVESTIDIDTPPWKE